MLDITVLAQQVYIAPVTTDMLWSQHISLYPFSSIDMFLAIAAQKSTEWINYLYYNKQCFINFTTQGLKGLSKQIAVTSLMSWQNRLKICNPLGRVVFLACSVIYVVRSFPITLPMVLFLKL